MQRLRVHLGLTVTEFADQTGITRRTVYNIEGGQNCGAVVWRKVRARWPKALRQLKLEGDDFIIPKPAA